MTVDKYPLHSTEESKPPSPQSTVTVTRLPHTAPLPKASCVINIIRLIPMFT